MIGVRGDMAAIGGGRGVEAEGGDRGAGAGAGGGRGPGPGRGQGTEGQGAGEGQGVTVEGATPGAEARIPSRAEIRDLSRGAEAEQRDLLRAQIKTGSQVTTCSINPSALNFIVISIPQLLMSFTNISPSKNNVFRKKLKLVFAAAETSSAVLICCADA